MTTSIIFLCVVMICYFAIRVNCIETRMNALEEALNQAVKEGKIDTEILGKPFGGGAGGIGDFWSALKSVWKER